MTGELRKYVNRKFLLYPKTEDILEVREELYSIALDRYEDCLQSGMSEDESYKRAIEVMGDFKEAIKEVERGSSLAVFKKNLMGAISFSSFYFTSLTLLYLLVSMIVVKTFEKTWLIAVGGAFVYLIYCSLSVYRYARLFSFRKMTRLGLLLIYLSLIPILYVFPSLYLSVMQSRSIWKYSWIIVLIIVFLWMVNDYILNRKYIPKFQRDLHVLVSGLVLTTIIYLGVSMRFGLWDIAWISYVVFLAVISLVFYISGKVKKE